MSEQNISSSINDQPQVEYRDIPGFPGYRVGNDGSVWSCRSRNGRGPLREEWRELRHGDNRGYLNYRLRRDGKFFNMTGHRLVLLAFVGPCPPSQEACHRDGDRANNRLSNLRWDTKEANWADAKKHGVHIGVRGQKNPGSKLNDASVRLIFQMAASGQKQCAIAAHFKVSHGLIHLVLSRKQWAHVTLD